jgi:hypothetical protein
MSWRPRRHCLPRHDDPRWIQLESRDEIAQGAQAFRCLWCTTTSARNRICIGGCSNVTTPSFRRWGVRNGAGDVDQPAEGIGRAFDAGTAAFRGLPEATGYDLKSFARLLDNGELWRMFGGGKIFRVSTPPTEDTPAATTARAALKTLEQKRRPPI